MPEVEEVVLYPGDLELVQRVRAQDPEAMEVFVQRACCIPRILYYQNRKLSQPLAPEDLLDVAQDTFARVWKSLDRYKGTGSLEAWLHRFCCNVLGNALQKRRRDWRMRSIAELTEAETPLSHQREQDLLEEERIWASVDQLDGDYGIVIQLKHQAGLTFEDIALRLNVPVNTAKTRYYRGLEQVRRSLGTAGGEPA